MAANIATLILQADPRGLLVGKRALDQTTVSAAATQGAVIKANEAFSSNAAGIAAAARSMGLMALAYAGFSGVSGSIQMARDFNAALAETSTLIEGTPAELDALTEASRAMSVQFGGTATAQMQAFYEALSAGVGNVSEATTFMDAANKLAVGGVTDVTTAVDVLTTAMNSYASTGLTAAEASDAMFISALAGKQNIDDLSASLGQIVPLTSNLGISFDEVNAALAALTLQGQTTSIATTGLRSAIANILVPTSQAADMAAELGIQFDVQALKAQGLSGFIDMVTEATDGNQEAMGKLFGSTEALTAMMAFAGGAGDAFAEILVDMENKAGATDAAFEKMANSLDQRWNRAVASMQDIGVRLGTMLMTVIVPSLEFMAEAVEGVQLAMQDIGYLVGWSETTAMMDWRLQRVSLAMDENARAARALTLELPRGVEVSRQMVEAKIMETEAYLAASEASRAQAYQVLMSSTSYLEATDRINSLTTELDGLIEVQRNLANAELGVGSMIQNDPAALSGQIIAIRIALVEAQREQEALLESVGPLSDAYLDAVQSVANLEVQLANTTGETLVLAETTETVAVATEEASGAAARLSDQLAGLALGGSVFGQLSLLASDLGVNIELAERLNSALNNTAGIEEPSSGPSVSFGDSVGPVEFGDVGNAVLGFGDLSESVRTTRRDVADLTTGTNDLSAALSGGSGGGGASGAADDLGQEFMRLMERLDPALAATNEFAEAQDLLNRALAAGITDQATYDDAMERLRDNLAESSNSVEDLARNITDDLLGAFDLLIESGGKDFSGFTEGLVSNFSDAIAMMVSKAASARLGQALGGAGGAAGGGAGSALGGLGSIIGSIIPGLGTVVGGVVGSLAGSLLGGLFGGRGNGPRAQAREREREQISETRAGLWRQILTLEGRDVELRQAELEQLPKSLRGLGERVQLLQQEAELRQASEGLWQQILTLEGRTAELRAMELATIPESLQHLQIRIWRLQDEAAATAEAEAATAEAAAAAEIILNERLGLENELLTLQGNTAELRRRELETLDPANRALQVMIWGLQDAKAAMEALSENDFATLLDYQRAVDRATNSSANLTGNVVRFPTGEPINSNTLSQANDPMNLKLDRVVLELQKMRDDQKKANDQLVTNTGNMVSYDKKFDVVGMKVRP